MRLLKSLYFWILIAFICGCTLGVANPEFAVLMEPLGTSFIKIVKVFIAPIIFLTVTLGIAQTSSLKKLGTIGFKAIVYFEIVSTIALLLGWLAALIVKPGALLHANINNLDTRAVSGFIESSEKISTVSFLQNIIPANIIEPFVKSDMLQVLVLAILFGIAILGIGEKRALPLIEILDRIAQVFFQIIKIVMYAAPIGIFGAMAYTVGKFGGQLLIPLLGLMGAFYFTGFVFVMVVLGTIAKFAGFSIIQYCRYIFAELVLVLGTSSSEAVLPQLIKKLEKLGCDRETVGVIVPMGYSFNLDGTNIYITLAALFIAQALGIELTYMEQFALFVTAMLSSKGAAGITGAGFVTLAATLSVVPGIPVVGIILIFGIDRFMSAARALINYIGNGVATIVVSRWENEITAEQLVNKLGVNNNSEEDGRLAPAGG